ncbi:hypothetical protein INR77_13230 [Erythrobacter sp. SCSIO 43205]|uniref:hypothetical protein n=1 Tax=Erythrobacter sp. SCSIO 43205 TaxID=2779361 RepID=UPI001CA971FE|nr:hypothetical protein [Erythrobacter sp. SCSIO 43205]UAB77732.1 hypothetical protein INR77_13230 [Erythrobacter sp. SCSIO 43205]
MRTPIKIITFVIAIFFAASGVAVSAQQPVTLEGAAYLMKREIDDKGQAVTKLTQPDVVVPGDRILFATEYRNVSASAVTNFVVTNPLPASVQLTPDADPELIVSVDGGSNWASFVSCRCQMARARPARRHLPMSLTCAGLSRISRRTRRVASNTSHPCAEDFSAHAVL